MGEKIRTAIEIAMEKAEKLSLSEEEKERIEIKKKIDPILARFFREELDPDGLWEELRQEKKPVLDQLLERLIDTLTINLPREEINRRKMAVLALEHLKKDPHTAYIEKLLDQLEDMSTGYRKEKEDFYNRLKAHIENNPKLLVRQVNSGGKKMLSRISVQEAINQSRDWQGFLSEHEKRYSDAFSAGIAKVRQELGV